MDIPHVLKNSKLHNRLQGDPDLLSEVLSLRSVASSLAETISRTVPGFTEPLDPTYGCSLGDRGSGPNRI
jgi:hypothetical protein